MGREPDTRSALSFGISRSNGGPQLLDGAHEFARVLAGELNTKIDVHVAYDYERLLRDVVGATVDLAWMPPLLHARAASDGAQLLAVSERGGALYYRSAILVRADSRFAQLRDLAGCRAAWVHPSSASGYLFPRLHLKSRGVDITTLQRETFLGSAGAACQAVVRDEADFCACFLSRATTHADAQAEVTATFGRAGESLRTLDITDPIPPDGIVASTRLPPSQRGKLTTVLLQLHEGRAGGAALKKLLQAERLTVPTPSLKQQLMRLQSISS